MRKKVLVKAPILTQSGYGEHSRFLLRALRSREDIFDIYAQNINWGQTNWLWEDNDERRWFDFILEKTIFHAQNKGQFDVSLQVTIPNEWEKIAPINIGLTAGIETTRVAPQWVEKSHIVDKIITISEHSKNVYANTTYEAQNQNTGEVINDFRVQCPIEIVHYPAKQREAADIEFDFETDFNFLAVAQWGPRKNLENTIKWFVEEFIDQEVGLVVKASKAKNCVYDKIFCENNLKALLSRYPQRKCKVYLLHGFMTEEEMTALYRHEKIKAYVSLSHGEGFGLPIFESAYNGLPIVAPAWSGHVDFLYMDQKGKDGKTKKKPMFATVDYSLVPIPKQAVWDGVLVKESMWCEPEQGSYKMRLRETYKDYGRFKSRATKLKSWVEENFEESKQYQVMINAIIDEEWEQESQTVEVV